MKRRKGYFQTRKTERKRGWQRKISLFVALILILSAITPTVAFGEMTVDAAEIIASEETVEPVETSEAAEIEETEAVAASAEPEEEDAAITEEETETVETTQEPLVLTDAATGVSITLPADAIPENINRNDIGIQVRHLTEAERQAYMDSVGVTEEQLHWVYDISLINKLTNEEIQPGNTVSVKVPESMPEDATVVRVDDAGTATEMDVVTVENGEVAFDTDHFTEYGGVTTYAVGGWFSGFLVTKVTSKELKLIIALYEEMNAHVSFCIQETKTFKGEKQYTVEYNVSVKDFNEAVAKGQDPSKIQTVTLDEVGFMRLKRMLYLYHTKYENSELNFPIDTKLGGRNDDPENQTKVFKYDDTTAEFSTPQFIKLKHWALFQSILHEYLVSGYTRETFFENSKHYAINNYNIENSITDSIRQDYYEAADDSSKDDIINAKYDFVIGKNSESQNTITIIEKESHITTDVSVNGQQTDGDHVLPLNIADLEQTDDGQKVKVHVTDTVNYYKFESGTYNVTASLYKIGADGNVTGDPIVKTATVNVDSENGSFDMDFGTVELDPNERYVVYERMVSTTDSNKVFTHEKADAASQSFTFPQITTTVKAGDLEATADAPVSITKEAAKEGVNVSDTIHYQNIPLGDYIVEAQLVEVEDPDEDGIYTQVGDWISTKTISGETIETPSGDLVVSFTDPVIGMQQGKRYVMYQTMTSAKYNSTTGKWEVENVIDTNGDGIPDQPIVIKHADPNDRAETIVVEGEKTSYRVKKIWDDSLDKQPVTVQLYADGKLVNLPDVKTSVVLNEENGWYYEWTNLPIGKTYEAREVVPSGAGFKAVNKGVQTIEIAGDEETTTTTETKWMEYDAEKEGLSTGDEIILVVAQEGESSGITAKDVVGKALSNNGTSLTWSTGLSFVENGEVKSSPSLKTDGELVGASDSITWKVTKNSDGTYKFTNKATGYWITKDTNYWFKATKSSIGAKSNEKFSFVNSGQLKAGYYCLMYNSDDGTYATRYNTESNINFNVYKQKEVTTSITTGTPSKSVEAQVIENVPGEETPDDETVSFDVTKTWDAGLEKESVQMQLYQDGQAYGDPVTVTEDMGWTYRWTDLPKGSKGAEHVYTVKELSSNPKWEAGAVEDVTARAYELVTSTEIPAGQELLMVVKGKALYLDYKDTHSMPILLKDIIVNDDGTVSLPLEEQENYIWKINDSAKNYSIITNKANDFDATYRIAYYLSREFAFTDNGANYGTYDKIEISSDHTMTINGYNFYINTSGQNAQIELNMTNGNATPIQFYTPIKHQRIHNNSRVGDIHLVKSEAGEDTKMLQGAEFELWAPDDSATSTIPGTENVKGIKVDSKTTGENGDLKFTGLAYGTYYLVESKAPSGYAKSDTAIKVVLTDEGVKLADDNQADNASIIVSTRHAIDKDGSVTTDTTADWSLCINGTRKHPGSGNYSKGNYVLHADVDYNDMLKYVDIGVSPTGHTVNKTSFSEDDYKAVKRILYWYLTDGKKTYGEEAAQTAAQTVLRKYVDGSNLTESSQDMTGYKQCYRASIDTSKDTEIDKVLHVHVYENKENGNLYTDSKGTQYSLQNMITATLENLEYVEVEGGVRVTNKPEEDTPLRAPETGGNGTDGLYRFGWIISLISILGLALVYVRKRRII